MKKNPIKVCVLFLAAALLCACSGKGSVQDGAGGANSSSGDVSSAAAGQEVPETEETSGNADSGDAPDVPDNAELMYEKDSLRVYLLQDASRNVPAFYVDLPQGHELWIENVVLNGCLFADSSGNSIEGLYERRTEELEALSSSGVGSGFFLLEDTFQNMSFNFYVCSTGGDAALADGGLRSPAFLIVRNTDGTYAFEQTGASGIQPEQVFSAMGIDMTDVVQEEDGYMLGVMTAEAGLTDYMYDVSVYGKEDACRISWSRGSSNDAGGSSEEQEDRQRREELETFLYAFTTDEEDRAALSTWWDEYYEYAMRGNPAAGTPSIVLNGWRFGNGSFPGCNAVYVGTPKTLSVPAREDLAAALPATGGKTYTIRVSGSNMDDLFAMNRGLLEITEITAAPDNGSAMDVTYLLSQEGKEYHFISTSFQTGSDYSNRAEGFEQDLQKAEADGAVIDFQHQYEHQVNGNDYTQLSAVYHYEASPK